MERAPKIILPGDVLSSRTWSGEVERLKRLRQERLSSEVYKDSLTLAVETRGFPYFALLPLSDIHLGHKGTDYEALGKYLEVIKRLPFYVITLGDLGDFFAPRHLPHAMLDDVIDPDLQLIAVKKFLQELGDKLIASVPGNHDKEFQQKTSGIDPYIQIAEEVGKPLLKPMSLVHLQVDSQKYKILLTHKYTRVNSMFNRTHAGKQAIRFNPHDNIDVAISGDKHVGSVEKTTLGDKDIVVIQTGTFKTNDDWGREMGFIERPTIFFPVILFDGRKKNIEIIKDLRAAEEFMDAISSMWKKKNIKSSKEAAEAYSSSDLDQRL